MVTVIDADLFEVSNELRIQSENEATPKEQAEPVPEEKVEPEKIEPEKAEPEEPKVIPATVLAADGTTYSLDSRMLCEFDATPKEQADPVPEEKKVEPEKIEPEKAEPEEPKAIPASVLAADGTTYSLDLLLPSQTIRSVKLQLAEKSGIRVGSQQMFVLHDQRQGIQNLELRNRESVGQAMQYANSETELQLAVMLGGANAADEFVRELSPTPDRLFEDGVRGACGVSFVPAYPQLLVNTDAESNTVVVRSTAGRIVCEFGGEGKGQGYFQYVYAIAFGEDGETMVVCDASNHRLQVLKLQVSDGGNAASFSFVRIISNGSCSGGSEPGQLKDPRGLAVRKVGEQERVLVADRANHRISEFDINDGSFICTYGSYGSGDGEFSRPYDVATLPSGGFAVADETNNRVQVFGANGTYERQFGNAAATHAADHALSLDHTDDGALLRPIALAADLFGNVLVRDMSVSPSRIQVFNNDGEYVCMLRGAPVTVSSSYRGCIAWDCDGRLLTGDGRKSLALWGEEGGAVDEQGQ
jgi:hypothetical protein